MLKLLSLTPTIKAVLITFFIAVFIFSIPLGIFVYLYNSYRVSYIQEVKETSALNVSNTQLRSDIDVQNKAIDKMMKETVERNDFIKRLQTDANLLSKKNDDLAKKLLDAGKKIPSSPPGQPVTIEECKQIEALFDQYLETREKENK